MYILGISGGTRQGYQDSAATLIKDGRVVAAVEEERLRRVKHCAGLLPELAIRYVLQSQGISIREVAYLTTHGSTWTPDFRPRLRRYMLSKFGYCPEIELVHHHDAHCASAYYASGFDEAMIISTDLSGDGISTELAIGRGQDMTVVERIAKPNSLGIFYSLLTQFCGFVRDNDEYKVMGLSSYGRRNSHDFRWLLDYGQGAYSLNPEYILAPPPGQGNPSKQEPFYSNRFLEKLGDPRLPDAPMTNYYEDIAASGQRHLEDVLVDLATGFHQRTGLRKLCLAGGVALNCVANQRLMNLDWLDQIYVQPAASDGGISLGAAYLTALQHGEPVAPLANVYLGPHYSNDQIKAALDQAHVAYTEIDDIAAYAARQVADNKIVGWFQGRMEFGPRALGCRSILANPTNPQMQDIVNARIKFREQFRPFCPSVLEEDAAVYFEGKASPAPYMVITYDVKDGQRDVLPSVTHVDQTARIQTVNHAQNPLYYQYLQELKGLIGVGVTMNTSFNVKGDPIVNTPFQALATFYGSGMDTLVIGNYILNK
jgi:carbamoyltransferase